MPAFCKDRFKINFARFLFVPNVYESLPACMSGVHGSQKSLWVPLELELGLVVSHCVGARNQALSGPLKTSVVHYGAISIAALELILW